MTKYLVPFHGLIAQTSGVGDVRVGVIQFKTEVTGGETVSTVGIVTVSASDVGHTSIKRSKALTGEEQFQYAKAA